MRRIVLLVVLAAIAFMALPASAQSKAKPRVTANTNGKRTAKAVEQELIALRKEIGGFSIATMIDPQYRESFLTKRAEPMRKRVALLQELEQLDPQQRSAARSLRTRDQAMLALWGDAEASRALEDASSGADAAEATRAKVGLALRDGWGAPEDAAAQAQCLNTIVALGEAEPRNEDIASALVMINSTAPDAKSAGRAADALAKLKSPTASRFNTGPLKIGKPLVINGSTVEGKPFSSKDWKGKVILVDFWATWCPPCREEIPETIKLYRDYKPEGLEIIGISSDNDKRELTEFVKSNAGMTWPHLFAGARGWHPLTKKYGVTGIPTYFMIDRNGLLRSTDARGELEEWTKRLLAEPAEATAAVD